MKTWQIGLVGALALGTVAVIGCGDTPPASTDGAGSDAADDGTTEPEPAPEAEAGPSPALIMVQAWFKMEGGKPLPQPAKMTIVRYNDGDWDSEVILDEDSNVFHKAMPWRDGILTIGAMGALLKHWTKVGGEWKAETLWEQSWGGKFDRLRDVEIGDLDGDGVDELALATHDQGVVAVGTEKEGEWTFAEFDQKADTFVHEVEIGDVDGDGRQEFYVTPSDRNRASGESQPGGVNRYDVQADGSYKSSVVVHWAASHAKEILVTDVDADGTDELYIVREAHTEKDESGKVKIIDPVAIVRMERDDDGNWSEHIATTLDDKQCRFLLSGDVDGDGKLELIAAGMDSGLWLLESKGDGTFDNVLIDKNSGGFEHATHVADLDGDGKLEIYVAADKQKELRQYKWNGESFSRYYIDDIDQSHITWNIQDGTF